MRRIDLLKSTPFRLAIIFATLFIMSCVVAGFITFPLLKQELADPLDQTIQDTYAILTASYGEGDASELSETVTSHVLSSSGLGRVFLLSSKDGQRLAGNIEKAEVPSGWSTVEGMRLGLANDEPYRVYSGQVDKQPLIVGMSFRENEEFLRIVFISFAWASVMVLILAAAGGVFLASRVQKRLETVASTMRKVGSGKLDVRIPLVGNGDDIDRLSEQVNQALGRVSSLVEGMRQVSTDIAHDLKTPLNRLSLTISQAIDRAGRGSSIVADLKRAQDESHHINATFDALLRIAQIEAGSRRSRFSGIDLRECLETIMEVYADVADDRKQQLRLSLEPNVAFTMTGDRELLIQLFANLVENSIRHSPEGAKIWINATRSNAAINVDVADNGPGIPVEERDKVFQRLYRLDKSRTTPGTGLGLSLVKAILDLHQASIALQDNAPGLRVKLSFPVVPPYNRPDLAATTARAKQSFMSNPSAENNGQ